MALRLQPGIVYGPVLSRRLGRSLGINLMPDHHKLCSFNCVYCKYGWTHRLTFNVERFADELPSVPQVLDAVESAVRSSQCFEYITFSGNGEPTMHPGFAEIAHGVIDLRDQLRPNARVALLTNSSGLSDDDVRQAVDAIDAPICKLEVGSRSTFYELNRPTEGIRFRDILESLTTLRGITLQSLFVDGHPCNVKAEEIAEFLGHVCMIQPREVQVYSTERSMNHNGILQLSSDRLEEIADRGSAATGIPFRAYYSA